MKKPEAKVMAKDFKVSFLADEVYLLSHLGLWSLVLAVGLVGFWNVGLNYKHTSLGILVIALSVFGVIVAIHLIFYILRLYFREGVIFSLDHRGLTDFASFCKVGYVLIRDIKQVAIRETIFGDFVLIRLHPNNLAVPKITFFNKILSWWQLKLNPNTLVIPMGVINVSRMNLETQFSHFGSLLREAAKRSRRVSVDNLSLADSGREGSMGEPPGKPTSEEFSDRLTSPTYKDPEPGDIEIPLGPNSSTENSPPEVNDSYEQVSEATLITSDSDDKEGTFVPPVANPSQSEKSRVIELINSLKQYVKKKELDAKICDIYSDYIVNFPEWDIHRDPRIPSTVTDIRSISQTEDYEEVGFRFKNESFHFALRRDLGPSELALLSLSYKGSVRVSLRVVVEIGTLEPERIEVFHRGQWEKSFLKLYSELVGDSFSRLDEDEEDSGETTSVDLDVLKQNFRISEDGDPD